jgi:2-keto-3-deoxy-L-fuconate dehydrogenase
MAAESEDDVSGRLAGKVAVITAAGQGIGRACALRFQEEGATVWATDVNAEALKKLAAEHPAIHTRILNVRDTDAVSAFAAELGAVDVLFNCAGYVHQGDIFACSQQDWDFSFDLNVTSMYRTCRAFLPAMIAAGKGSVLNMSSVASSIKGAPNRFVYGTTKAAVIGLTKAIAADVVSKGVRCNAICPGTIETPSLHDRMAAQGDVEKARAAFLARQPMGRLGTAAEIAELALHLASDESSFTTGQTHIIDGGWAL